MTEETLLHRVDQKILVSHGNVCSVPTYCRSSSLPLSHNSAPPLGCPQDLPHALPGCWARTCLIASKAPEQSGKDLYQGPEKAQREKKTTNLCHNLWVWSLKSMVQETQGCIKLIWYMPLKGGKHEGLGGHWIIPRHYWCIPLFSEVHCQW